MHAHQVASVVSDPFMMILWTIARQAPLSMGFSRQECWSGFPCRPTGDLPDPGIEPGSLALQADSLLLSNQGRPLIGQILRFPVTVDQRPVGLLKKAWLEGT